MLGFRVGQGRSEESPVDGLELRFPNPRTEMSPRGRIAKTNETRRADPDINTTEFIRERWSTNEKATNKRQAAQLKVHRGAAFHASASSINSWGSIGAMEAKRQSMVEQPQISGPSTKAVSESNISEPDVRFCGSKFEGPVRIIPAWNCLRLGVTNAKRSGLSEIEEPYQAGYEQRLDIGWPSQERIRDEPARQYMEMMASKEHESCKAKDRGEIEWCN